MKAAAKLALWGVVALLTATCGKGSGSSGPVTAPTAPSGPSLPDPPAVDVGGDPNGQFTMNAWNGQGSADGIPSGLWRLVLTQSGAQVTGTISAFGHAGPFAGTVSGNTLYFNFSVGHQGQGCGNAISGTATVGTRSMTGTFSGHDCAGGHHFEASFQKKLFHEGIADLYVGALLLGFLAEFGGGEKRGAVNAVATGFCADIDDWKQNQEQQRHGRTQVFARHQHGGPDGGEHDRAHRVHE